MVTLSYTIAYASTTTTYSFRVRNGAGCPNYVNNTIASSSITTLAAYPNPNNGAFIVNLSSPINEGVQITITNILGQKVVSMVTVTNKETDMKPNTLPGIYFIPAITKTGQWNAKIVIK